ncbi:tRNA (adenosine(37)-N6)-threonylcarbamoyltransferase complex transferase subunit TsaD [bacterium]|nr:MAG: tRNA (adenosine(37)-N6)-threonylcarbamoyltransferase complex transferase subunit TsaD [bacterium]
MHERQTLSREITIGIESTHHVFGVGIVDSEGHVWADVRRSFQPKMGGVHPREASRFFASRASEVIFEALHSADLSLADMSYVAFSRGPGLGPCLRVGATAARALAMVSKKALVGVNHAAAHLEIARRMSGASDPVFLYVSGGNTQVITSTGQRYLVLGETEDIAVGNMMDSFGKSAGLGFPGGPEIEELARRGKRLCDIPYSVKGMNVSMSGTLTKAESLIGESPLEDIAFSLQEVAFSMLIEVSERAMAYLAKEEMVVAGGVGLNSRLREMAKTMCAERGAKFLDYEPKYYGDNGVMIAWLGCLLGLRGERLDVLASNVFPRWRIEDVAAPDREERQDDKA